MTATENRPVVDGTVTDEFGGSGDQLKPSGPSSHTAAPFVPTSEHSLVEGTVRKYLASIDSDPSVELPTIRDELLNRLNGEISFENLLRKANESPSPRIQPVSRLDEMTITSVLLARERIVSIDLAEGDANDLTLLAKYVAFGEDEGIHSPSERGIKVLISELNPSMSSRGIDSVYQRLRNHARVVYRTLEPHLIPVRNGVFDHARQELRPFSPTWVFLSKIPVDYNSTAASPLIDMPDGGVWEFEAWLRSLSDDPGVFELLWEIISAAVRSNVKWGKSVWFFAERGNNGKGTFIQMLRNLLGSKASASVKFADFGHEFKMAPLVSARVNLVDENGVGSFAEDISDWKSVITGDVCSINRKYKDAVAVRLHIFEIQCFNSEAPRAKDKSESFYRRLLMLPFRKWFGRDERQYIKTDFLARPAVLEFVLSHALHMQHKKLSNPKVCKDALDEYRGANNVLATFWREFEHQLTWDLIPFRFLHDLYREWFRRTNPSGHPESQNQLVAFLKTELAESLEWEHRGVKDVRPKDLMDAFEPLIIEYNLTEWMNSNYSGSDPVKKGTVSPLKINYKGLVRHGLSWTASSGISAESEPE